MDEEALSLRLLPVALLGRRGWQTVARPCLRAVDRENPNPVNEPELHAYLTNFYVIPEMRGQGFGKELLNKALSWCRTRETDAVILWATLASRSLYRRCGLVEPTDMFELRRSAHWAH